MNTGFSAKINYQHGANAKSISAQPSIDRARGGIIKIELTIPQERVNVTGGPGAVTIPKKVCTFEIDLEQLPLVNVAGYQIDQEQISPERMSYPYGGDFDDGDKSNTYGGAFKA